MDNLRDTGVERAVLASVFAHGLDAFTDAADLMTARTLTDPAHQAMWGCASRIFSDDPKSTIDFPLLMATAKGMGVESAFAKPEDLAVVRAVFNLPVSLSNTRKLAGKLRKLEFARDALAVVDDVRASFGRITGDESVEGILSQVETPILDISSLLNSAGGLGPQAVGQGLRAYAAHLANNPRDVVGVPSGYRLHDASIGGGYRPGTVNVVGARSGCGKSLLATNVALRVAGGCGYDWPRYNPAGQIPVLQLDTEMTREDQWTRQLAAASGVYIDDIETGKYAADPRKRKLVEGAIDLYETLPYDFMPIAGMPFEETEATMRRWLMKRVGLNDDGSARPCLIIFDYLKLMDSSSMESKNLAEFQVLGFMMTRLHNFAVKFKVPILTFIQLNRDGINVEDESAASGSDRIIWLCSNFSIYKKKTEEEMAEQIGEEHNWNRKMIPIKQRHGGGLAAGDYVNFMSHGATARITEGPTRDGRPVAGVKAKGTILSDEDQDAVDLAA